ncbi:MAG TPA: lanthionine synthetase LanC family protein [Thermoanaerobaculia bacterium]|nr:lanthionine synthetase LanC family protein [Thermoanaerobaculia bacterium]
MAITDPLLLPPDVLLVPVAELPEELRGQLRCEEGDYAVTRPRSRTPSRVVDAQAAALIAEFKSPCTIVEAILRYSLAREVDPEETLEQAYPLLQGLVSSGFLVAEGDAGAESIHPTLLPGDEIAGFEVVECVQGLEDTELYQVRRLDNPDPNPSHFAALKIERPASAGKTGLFEREAAILEHLDGGGAPRLLASGEIEGRRYLAIEWLPGVDAVTAADELRRSGDRTGLLALCRAIARAYSGLHERGVIHGDVHPRNVLAADGGVRLIDYGIARWDGAPNHLARIWRGGVAFYFEPEYALAAQAGLRPPDATPAGEQYGVATLIYQLAAGVHYRDFSLEKTEMLRQIAEEPPLPFANRGIDPWPDLEAVLSRSLSKNPEDRFASLAELANALDCVEAGEERRRPASLSPVESLLARVLDRIGAGGSLFVNGLPTAPRGSINYGSAGIAYACLRLAQTREDSELLSLADLWVTRALRDVNQEDSFYNPEIGLGPDALGRVSPYHTANGLFCVQALVSHAQGDGGTQREAVAAFLAGAGKPCENPDLTLGRSGVLLAAALLFDTVTGDAGDANAEARKELTALGDGLLSDLWKELDSQPPIARCDRLANLGIAHGWAGYLYASLQWCRAAGTSRPARLEKRLAELAAAAQPWGRGVRWPWYGTEEGHRRHAGSMAGWCNGSAGFVFLWTLAYRELGNSRWLALAEAAAMNTWESPDGNGSLCCGLGGRAYALLNYHRHAGGPQWLARARDLANRAALDIEKGSEREDSLYKGTIGVALLAADLAKPETAAMPFFEEEGWSDGASSR